MIGHVTGHRKELADRRTYTRQRVSSNTGTRSKDKCNAIAITTQKTHKYNALLTRVTQRPPPTSEETVAEVKFAFTRAKAAHVRTVVALDGPSGLHPLNKAFCAAEQFGSQQQSGSHSFAVRSQTHVPISVFAVTVTDGVVEADV